MMMIIHDDDDDDDNDYDHCHNAFEHSLNRDAHVAAIATNNKNNSEFQSCEMTIEVQATCELFESIIPSMKTTFHSPLSASR
jgi:hypothetical protein